MIRIDPPCYLIAVSRPQRETLEELNRRLLRDGYRAYLRGTQLFAVRVH